MCSLRRSTPALSQPASQARLATVASSPILFVISEQYFELIKNEPDVSCNQYTHAYRVGKINYPERWCPAQRPLQAKPKSTKRRALDTLSRRTHCASFQLFQLSDALQNFPLRALLHLARKDELIQDGINLVEVEHNVELAHIREVLVEQLYE